MEVQVGGSPEIEAPSSVFCKGSAPKKDGFTDIFECHKLRQQKKAYLNFHKKVLVQGKVVTGFTFIWYFYLGLNGHTICFVSPVFPCFKTLRVRIGLSFPFMYCYDSYNIDIYIYLNRTSLAQVIRHSGNIHIYVNIPIIFISCTSEVLYKNKFINIFVIKAQMYVRIKMMMVDLF